MDIKTRIIGLTHLFAAIFFASALASCNRIFEQEGDCSLHCTLKFRYDMNMKFADAFSNSVSHIEVYVYDTETGALLFKQEECGEKLSSEDYVMELEGLAPGSYDIAVWGGDGLCKEKFILDAPETGHYMTDVICTMQREEGNVKEDVGSLFYGMKRVTFEGTYGTHQETIYLTKNTNTVRVVLQHLSGIDVNPDEFIFKITDENGVMAYDNNVLEDEVLTYFPWSVTSGSAGIDAELKSTKAQTSVSVALAEFTLGRLVTGNDPILSISNKVTGKTVLSIPFKDYALLVKGNYNKDMSDQEYLDRQDEYNLTFFLDEHGNWLTSQIIINSWHLVLQDSELN